MKKLLLISVLLISFFLRAETPYFKHNVKSVKLSVKVALLENAPFGTTVRVYKIRGGWAKWVFFSGGDTEIGYSRYSESLGEWIVVAYGSAWPPDDLFRQHIPEFIQ